MRHIANTLASIALLILTSSANATMITGTIDIAGQSAVTDNGSTSTGIDFTFGVVLPSTGDFSALGGQTTVFGLTLNDFMYSDIPEHVLWSIDHGGLNYSYTLTSLEIGNGNSGDYSTLSLSGNGFFSITGFEDTYGSWLYTQSGGSFSSESVPEPATIALVGLGLIGFGVARRMKKSL